MFKRNSLGLGAIKPKAYYINHRPFVINEKKGIWHIWWHEAWGSGDFFAKNANR